MTEFVQRAPAIGASLREPPPCTAAIHRTPPWIVRFYEAYLSADPAQLDAVLDDDVSWLISGPAEQVDFFGLRRGKPAVIELITRIVPCYQKLTGFEIEQLLVEGEKAAVFGRICAQQRETRRSIRFAFAHFLRFRDGRLISMRALADSFDAIEQIMGCRITLATEPGRVPVDPTDLVAAV